MGHPLHYPVTQFSESLGHINQLRGQLLDEIRCQETEKETEMNYSSFAEMS